MLTLDKTSFDRSLQRSWSLVDAEPVRSYLPPYTGFMPADLRIWWSAETGQAPDGHTLSIYAWPKERGNTLSAHWRDGYNRSQPPAWIKELSEVVHQDLIANVTTPTGTEDIWAYSAESCWTVEDGTPVPSLRSPHEPFAPGDLSIWHSYSPREVRQNRHSIRAFPVDRRNRQSLSAHWDGGVSWDGTPDYDPGLPEWIRGLAEAQHLGLVARATQFELERETP